MSYNKKHTESIKKIYTPGTKIILHSMEGESLPAGSKGEITAVDGIGQIHVNWENGSSLALNADLDSFEIIK